MENLIAQGAEAKIILSGNNIIKKRIKKSYRFPILDEKLRKQRTKKEAKLLEKAGKVINVPKIIKTDEKNKELHIEFIKGLKLSENLDSHPNCNEICKQIGKNIAKIHDLNIIHGDLTTSNMIYVPANMRSLKNNKKINKDNKEVLGDNNLVIDKDNTTNCINQNLDNLQKFKVYFIDFGLGSESLKDEDKAVDLHVLNEALEARHPKKHEELWSSVISGYTSSKNAKNVLLRLKAVEKRGRYKGNY